MFSPEGKKRELVHLIDVVTTNKTDFFREAGHFDYLVSKALPDLAARHRREPKIAGLERGLLDRRGTLHAGHGAQRICAEPPRFSLQRAGNRYLHGGAGQGVDGHLQVRGGEARFPRTCGESTSCAAGIRGSDLVRVVPELRATVEFRRLNFMDADFGLSGDAGNHLLPERDHLFRPADAGPAAREADPATRARRVLLCGPFRVASGHGLAAGSGRYGRLQEGGTWITRAICQA